MEEEIKKDETVTDETKEEEVINDESGETKEEEDKGEKKEEAFNEDDIDEDVKNYKPPVPKEDEDDDIDAEDKARIEKVVEKKYGTTLNEIQKKAEFDTFFNANPEMGKYRKAVEIYKAHPTYAGVPIHNLAAMLSAKDQQKIGAAKEREAAAKVLETKNPGGTVRKPAGEGNNWMKASKEDFEAQKAKVLGRQGN